MLTPTNRLFSKGGDIIYIEGMKLNFFFDIDGTLLPFGKEVPQSAVEAVRKAREDGHNIFIASGRSLSEIDPRLDVIEFDGGVYSNGATVIYHDKTLYSIRMTGEDVSFLRDYAEINGFLTMVQSDEGTIMTEECRDCFISSVERITGRCFSVPNLITYPNLPSSLPPVCKFLFLSREHQIGKVKELSTRFEIVGNSVGLPQSDMVEVGIKGLSKASGIKKLIGTLGEDVKSVVAVGDGANDREMIEYAHLGIAMGNATEEIKGIADWVTTSIDNDGIKNAVKYAVSFS